MIMNTEKMAVTLALVLPGLMAISGTNNPAGVTNVPVSVPVVTAAVASVSAPAPDPRVGKVLMALATHLQSSRRFRCDVSFLITSGMEGMKQEISATYALAVEKPNLLALRHLRGMAGNSVICNGKQLVTYSPVLNRYEESEAPQSFEQLSQGVGPMSGNMLFVDNLLRDDVYASIMDGVTKVTYMGKETLDGQECERLKFIQDQFDWDLWVSTGLKPVVVQVLSDMTKGLSSLSGEGIPDKGMKMTVLNRFSSWQIEGVLPTGTFDFKPPPGAKKADVLFEGEEGDALDLPPVAVTTAPPVVVTTNAVSTPPNPSTPGDRK